MKHDPDEFEREVEAELEGREELDRLDELAEREDSFRNDVEADADALASAGMGTDEDYEHGTPCDDGY